MAETIEELGSGAKWHWYNVMSDLIQQGGLSDVVIDPLSVDAYGHGCGGQHGDNRFFISWLHNQFLLVTMQRFSQQLLDAFVRVVEYQPFCRYYRDGMVTIEWDKNDPNARFEDLQREGAITSLVGLKGAITVQTATSN